MRARITGTGSYVPAKVLTNADLERMVATSDEWIVERTGIRERACGRSRGSLFRSGGEGGTAGA